MITQTKKTVSVPAKSHWNHQDQAFGPFLLTRTLRSQMLDAHCATLHDLLGLATEGLARARQWDDDCYLVMARLMQL